MKIHLLLIGTELLQGKITDAQTAYLGRFLTQHSLELQSVQIIGDQPETMLSTMKKLSSESDLLIISGGLGPTLDDLTKNVLAKLLGHPLEFSPRAFSITQENYQRQNRDFNDPQHGYCFIPKDVIPLNNPTGFAPGLLAQVGRCKIFCLPGVPHEFQSIFESMAQEILPRSQEIIELLNYRTHGVPEEKIFKTLCPTLWQDLSAVGEVVSLPHVLAVDIGVKLKANSEEEIKIKKSACDKLILSSALKDYLWHIGFKSLEEVILEQARSKKLKIATAESCTGGLNAHRLTNISGSSDVFWGGIVSYANDFKSQFLDVDPDIISKYGAVSSECAQAMAKGLRLKSNVDIVVSTTGIAGPTGGTHEKPVGLVWVALSTAKNCYSLRYEFKGPREIVKTRFSQAALFALLKEIKNL